MSKSELKRLCAVDHVGMAEKMAAQEAELTSLREKNAECATLRSILCGCLDALNNGAVASPDCSLAFMSDIPKEVGAVVTQFREKCAEMECKLNSATDMRSRAEITRDEMTEKYFAEKDRADGFRCLLQVYREEAAKQEPVGWLHVSPHHGGGMPQFHFKKDSHTDMHPVYDRPINLPAIIEQAKAEVRAEYSDVVPRSRLNAVDAEMLELQDKLRKYYEGSQGLIEQAKMEERESALSVMRKAVIALASAAESNPIYQDAYKELDAAIRARSEK